MIRKKGDRQRDKRKTGPLCAAGVDSGPDAFSFGTRRVGRASRRAQALPDFDMALKMNRKLAWAYSAKAWLLATCPEDSLRDGAEALKFAQKALSLQDHWKAHDALAAAYAELGRFEDSLRELKVAQEQLAADEQAAQWQPYLQARLEQYEARQPYRERPSEALAAREWLASAY
jgi:tetratricopeptide (TPR) repeat protein